MKVIKLQKSKETIQVNGNFTEIDLNTVDLLRICLNSPVEGGYSISELMIRLKLLYKIEKAISDTIGFEDAEFNELSKIVKSTKWNILSRNILEFTQLFN